MGRDFLPPNGKTQTPLGPGARMPSSELGLALLLSALPPSVFSPHGRTRPPPGPTAALEERRNPGDSGSKSPAADAHRLPQPGDRCPGMCEIWKCTGWQRCGRHARA